MPKIIIIGSILTVVGLVLILAPKKANQKEIFSGGLLILIAGLLVLLFSGIRIIPAGHVGVQAFFGDVKDEALPAGFHIINPLINVIPMSIRTEAYTMSSTAYEGRRRGNDAIIALTSDGVSIKLDVTGWFKLKPDQAPKVYKTLGLDYSEKIVRPALRTAIRNAVVGYKSEDIYSKKRKEAVVVMETIIRDQLGKRGIEFERILLRNIILPQRITKAIDEKISAQQEAQKMEFIIQREQREAQRKEIEAQGIAKAQKIIADSLTTEYLTWHYVKTLSQLANSPNSTFVITPFDQKLIPMLNMPASVSNNKKEN
ncbi:prohibitin family protein [bacterium]|nr:prohibitin family protein [bacterium]